MTEHTTETALQIATDWRTRVWGTDEQGAEHIITIGRTTYMVTEGTGEGVYAYLITDVAAWLESDEGLGGDDWRAYLRESDDPDYSQAPYQRFCAAVDPDTDPDTGHAVWRALRLAICDGGSPIYDEDQMPAETATEEEVTAALADELGIDPERVHVDVDPDCNGNAYWTARVDDLVDDEDEDLVGDDRLVDDAEAEVSTPVGAVRVTYSGAWALKATELDGVWCVQESTGAVWSPSDEAAALIARSGDPATHAVDLCRMQPMCGKWTS